MDSTLQTPQLWQLVPSHLAMHREFERSKPHQCEDDFRHSGWAPLRRRIFDSLVRTQQPAARVDAFVSCGAGCSVWFNEKTGEVRTKASFCHDRFCQPCARARGSQLQAGIRNHVPRNAGLRFVTLTLRHSSLPLTDVLDRLRTSFTLLRNRRFWKDRVVGGVAVLEVKLSKAGQWHPHLHILVQGSYIPQDELSKTWLAITGDSHVVDVRRVASAEDEAAELARYVTKYITKPAGLDVFTDDQKLDEYLLAMKGQRVLNFLGSWRGIMNEDDEDETVSTENGWQMLGYLTTFNQRAAEGDPFAVRVLAALSQPAGVAPLAVLVPDTPTG